MTETKPGTVGERGVEERHVSLDMGGSEIADIALSALWADADAGGPGRCVILPADALAALREERSKLRQALYVALNELAGADRHVREVEPRAFEVVQNGTGAQLGLYPKREYAEENFFPEEDGVTIRPLFEPPAPVETEAWRKEL